jgi:hypothetical protein
MRRRITWRTAAAISMLGLAPAGIGAAFAVPAGASTYACATALGTQCGTFTESAYNAGLTDLGAPPPGGGDAPLSARSGGGGASGGLGWAVMDASSAANTPLIVGQNYSPGTDQGTDLTKVEHYGTIPGSPGGPSGIGYWYSFVYTPFGVWTSMCVSNPNNPGPGGSNLVLRPCNQQMWQAFLALPIYGGGNHRLPPPPTWRAPTSSVPIPNASSTSAYALYSMANGRFVEVTRPGSPGPGGPGPGGPGPGGPGPGSSGSGSPGSPGPGSPGPGPGPGSPGPGPGPGYKGGALSATAHSGEPVTNTNTWFWTNANGLGHPK